MTKLSDETPRSTRLSLPDTADRLVLPPVPMTQRLVRFGFQTLGRLFPRTAGRVALRLFCTPLRRARHRRTDALLERAEVFEFMAGRHLLKGYRWGDPARPAVVLAHGWESRGTALREFVPHLEAGGYQVVAFDAPAHGDSPGKRTHLPEYAGALESLVGQLGEPAGIIGHSFGGASALYALCRPDGTLRVPKFVLVNSPAEMRWVFDDARAQLGMPAPVFRHFISGLERLTGIPDVFALDAAQLRSGLRATEVLIVHDELDPVIAFDQARKNLAQLPNSRLLITRGAGHFKLLKRPAVRARIAAFIQTPAHSAV